LQLVCAFGICIAALFAHDLKLVPVTAGLDHAG
jgi:hypothetical protein